MSEKDLVSILPPQYSLPTTGSAAEPIFISVTTEALKPPSTIIVVAPKQDVPQYAKTAGKYFVEGMPLVHVENAKHNTGGYSLRVPRLHLPEDQLEAVKKGDILGDTVTWAAIVGEEKDIPFIVTSSPINPFTGERLPSPQQETTNNTLPGAYNMVQIAQSPNIEQPAMTTSASQLPTGPAISYDNGLANNPYLKVPAELKKTA